MKVSRLLLKNVPFGSDGENRVKKQHLWGKWTARWLSFDTRFAVFRNKFSLPEEVALRIHVSADSGYRLYLDGAAIACGPEHGDRQNYFFDSFCLDLPAGPHTLVAIVWHYDDDDNAPMATIGTAPGFILAAEGRYAATIDTNRENWRCARLEGLRFEPHDLIGWHCIGQRLVFDRSAYPYGIESGNGGCCWKVPGEDARGVNRGAWDDTAMTTRFLVPAALPDQINIPIPPGRVVYVGAPGRFYAAEGNLNSELAAYQAMLNDGTFYFAPHIARKILIDLGDYYCGQPEFVTSKGLGAEIVISWTEALYRDTDAGKKDNRTEFYDKYFFGQGDRFLPDGGADDDFFTLQYRAGRFVELQVATADAPLFISRLKLLESRYPMTFEGAFHSSDERLNRLRESCLRTLQMCAHDTYMDCPFYEQLMYVGDTRIQLLLNYVINNDRRLADKSMRMFAASQQPEGLISSRYPSRQLQNIPTFSLIFVAMVNDYVKYVNHVEVTKIIVPAVIRILDYFQFRLNSAGLLAAPEGWNFVDWTSDWCADGRRGTPPDGENGVSGVLNLLYLYALGEAVELFAQLGEPELSSRFRRHGESLCACSVTAFFRPEAGLFADSLAGDHFSEHAQCLALLSGFLDRKMETTVQHNLFDGGVYLTRTTVYFSFYYLEICGKYDRYDKFMERMEIFFSMHGLGLKTMLESPEPSRSDCHAWSSHPLYHFYATLLGIRPASPGFASVRIQPMSGITDNISAHMPHEKGMIEVMVDRHGSCVTRV